MDNDWQLEMKAFDPDWKLRWHPDAEVAGPDGDQVSLHRGRKDSIPHRLLPELALALQGPGLPLPLLDRNAAAQSKIPRPQWHRLHRLMKAGFLAVWVGVSEAESVQWHDATSFERKPWDGVAVLVPRAGTHLRWENGRCLIESLSLTDRLSTRDPLLVARLARLIHQGSDGGEGRACETALIELLWSSGFLVSSIVADREAARPDSLPGLAGWHEQVFHHKWRQGLQTAPVGALYPGIAAGRSAPPLFPEEESWPGVALPNGQARDAGLGEFVEVLARRRSVRASGGSLPLDPLAAFLEIAYHPQFIHPQCIQGETLETLWRPTAAGGSLHELDLFVSVSDVEDLVPGLYYYASSRHVLVPIPFSEHARLAMRKEAEAASHYSGSAAVQLLLFSRLQRLLWKYEAMAYAISLQNAGALQQTFYLVATALGLAPCSIGNGNEKWLQSCPALSSNQRWWVGNFLLSTVPSEGAGSGKCGTLGSVV